MASDHCDVAAVAHNVLPLQRCPSSIVYVLVLDQGEGRWMSPILVHPEVWVCDVQALQVRHVSRATNIASGGNL